MAGACFWGWLTVGNAVLKGAEDEHNDWKPQGEDLAGCVAGGQAEHDGHADHCVCWNSSEEYLAPIYERS